MKKKLLSLLLAIVMVASVLPVAVFPVVANDGGEPQPEESSTYTYDDLYVRDADGDGENDIVFLWDAFDVTAETEVTGTLQNRVEGGTNVTYDADLARAHDGFMTFYQVMEFGQLLSTHIVNDGDVDYRVDEDSTFELLIAQDPTVTMQPLGTGYHTSPVTGDCDQYKYGCYTYGGFPYATIYIANTAAPAPWSNNGPIDDSYGYVSATTMAVQGYFTPENWKGTEFRTFNFMGDNLYYAACDGGQRRMFGEYQGVPFAMTSTVEYNLNEDGHTGTGLVKFFRNGAPASPWCDTSDGQYTAPDKKVYLKYTASEDSFFPKMTAEATNSYSRASFGHELGFAFYAVRLYNADLSEEQIAQNHFADLLGYNDIPVSERLLALDEETRTALYMSLADVTLTEITAQEIEQAIKAITAPKYTELYVTDVDGDGVSDLTFAWDAFDITASSFTSNTNNPVSGSGRWPLVNRVGEDSTFWNDGALTAKAMEKSIILYGHRNHATPAYGRGSNGLNLKPGLNYTTASTGEIVFDDMTMEISLAQSSTTVLAPLGSGQKHESINPYYDGGSYANAVRLGALDWGFSALNTEAEHPIDESYGFVSSSYRAMKEAETNETVQIASDVFWMPNGRFLGNYVGDPFYIAITQDYEMDTETTGTVNMKFFRDGANTLVHDKGTLEDGVTVNYTAETMPTVEWQAGVYLNIGMQFYTARMYNKTLSKAQMAQNHFADLVGYHGAVLTEEFVAADAEDQAVVFEKFVSVQYNDTSKAELEEALANFTPLTYGAHKVLTLDGYQARLVEYPAIRALFTVDENALEEGATIKAAGVIVAIAEGNVISDLTVTEGENGYEAPEDMDLALFYDETGWVDAFELTYGEGEDAYTLTHVAYEGGFPNPAEQVAVNYMAEVFFRGFVVVTIDDVDYVCYTDMTGAFFPEGKVSIYELCKAEPNAEFEMCQQVVQTVDAWLAE